MLKFILVYLKLFCFVSLLHLVFEEENCHLQHAMFTPAQFSCAAITIVKTIDSQVLIDTKI